MLNLNVSDTMTIVSPEGLSVFSIPDGLINAQGFLYSPVGGSRAAVAWSVAACKDDIRGGVVKYDTVNINTNRVWNAETGKVTIDVAGTYFIDLTGYLCGAGAGWGNGAGNPGMSAITGVN
jgi:hypothetical protein